MSSARWSAALRYGLPGLLIGLAASWVFGGGRSPAVQAQGMPPALASGTIAFSSPSATGAGQWLYLIDTRTQSFAVYRVDPQNPKGAVKLEAARQYRWDLKLSEYNNQKPEVAAVEAMVGGTAGR